MHVIGTAGHVDHGKSTLVHRLTNIDPDRLAEEQAREMTIDLGFAWFHLPNGEMVGIVDVPGHRDFIENMLAGVGGIQAVMLVIAADEGVMPQTREHLAILDLLGIESGLVALTKTDLVKDPEWLELVVQDIEEVLNNTSLQQAPIVPVSAHTGGGIPALVDQLSQILTETPANKDYNHPHLAIDRVFTISGFGTIVTGTLLGGTLQVGADIEIQPTSLRGRIRGLQSYKQQVEVALPGSRVAVNITGIEKSAIERGHVLTTPHQQRATILTDVYFRHLPDASRSLRHNAEIKFFVGAAETTARARLLNTEQLLPGEEGWLQVRLAQSLAITRGDRFIVRYPSPPETIGGGVIVNPHPGRRWKRFQPQIIEQLELQMQGTPADRITQVAHHSVEPLNRAALQQQVGLNETELENALNDAIAENLLLELYTHHYLSAARFEGLQQQIIDILANFHQQQPLRQGMPREQTRNQLGVKQPTFVALIENNREIVAKGSLLYLADHKVQFSPAQKAAIDRLQHVLQATPYTPPTTTDAVGIVGEDVFNALVEGGDIVRVQPEIIFSRSAYQDMVTFILRFLDEHGSISAAELRDHFQTTRKYAIGLLEYLDNLKITRRQGNRRVPGPNA